MNYMSYNMDMWIVDFYERENGDCPVEEFIYNTLEKKLQSKTLATVDQLKILGNLLGEPKSKHLDDGIFELRMQVATNSARILYFFYVDRKIILTNGFIKKTNKLPKSELDKAKRYREDYIRRNKL